MYLIVQKKPRPSSRSFGVDEVGRGCEKQNPHYNQEPGFYVIAIEKVFSFCEDWHQNDCASPLVQQYQVALDSVLKSDTELQKCVAHCVHCGIRFLTDSRCAYRTDLRCPFGCRQHHRRQRSNERSTAYYQTPSGRRKKKLLNACRSCDSSRTEVEPRDDASGQLTSPNEQSANEQSANEQSANEQRSYEPSSKVELSLEGVVLRESTVQNSPMLPYVRMIVSLIEGIRLTNNELVNLLRQALRQHSMAYRRRVDYVLSFLHEHPP